MIKIAMYTTIITLFKQGISQRQIAKITKSDRKTVARIITRYQNEQITEPVAYKRASSLDDWHQHIVELLAKNLSYVRILEELQLLGYNGSYVSLTRYIKKHNIKTNTCIRFHTEPGEEAQVDFGYIGKQIDANGKSRKAYVFNMRLSFSRLDYYEVVFDQTINTWINCHIKAFKFFGGVPRVIKLDNLKAGIIKTDFYEPVFQKEYNRLGEHYGCLLSPCRPYQPQEKGKVESGIKYIKNNFFAGRSFNNFTDLNYSLNKWLDKANTRIHGTTKSVPLLLFNQQELLHLLALPLTEFDNSTWHYRKVAKDCHITIDNNYYSVPAKYVSCDVLVKLSTALVQVYSDDNALLASHARATSSGVFSTDVLHYDKHKRSCPGFSEYNEDITKQIEAIGANSALLLTALKASKSRDWYRSARGIINLRKNYSNELIDKACLRALHYGVYSYTQVKNILVSNAINLPLPEFGGEYAKLA